MATLYKAHPEIITLQCLTVLLVVDGGGGGREREKGQTSTKTNHNTLLTFYILKGVLGLVFLASKIKRKIDKQILQITAVAQSVQ
jgi:hypothetical protein